MNQSEVRNIIAQLMTYINLQYSPGHLALPAHLLHQLTVPMLALQPGLLLPPLMSTPNLRQQTAGQHILASVITVTLQRGKGPGLVLS